MEGEPGEDEGRGEGESAPTLRDVDLDQLLHEVIGRVQGVLDEQERTRHLLDAVVGITSELSLDGVLERIVLAAGSLTGAQYAALGVLGDGPERRLRTFVHHGVDEATAAAIGDLPVGHGLLGLLIDDPRPIRLRDIAAHPASYGFPEQHPPMSSFLGVPVRTRELVFGNLYLTEKAGGQDFSEFDESVAVTLAAAAGVAIENANLYERASRRQAWLSATAEITALLADDSSADQALQVVADRARWVSGADVAWVVTGADPQELCLKVVSGAPLDPEAMQALRMEHSLASIVVRTGVAVSVDDLTSDPRAVDPSTIPGWPRIGPAMVLPLRSSNGVEGVLSLGWTPDNLESFHRVAPELPTSFAEHATLALQLARARDDRIRLSLYEDRDRIGRDLHDLVIQRLFAVGLGLQSAAHRVDDEAVAERLHQAIDDIDDTIKDIRRTIFALGSLGSAEDVQSEIEAIVDRAGATMKLRPKLLMEGPIRTTVPAELVPDLLAVLAESLTNVSRHAHASSVVVRVSAEPDWVQVSVSDDGRGMEPDVRESGLDNLRSRASRHGGDLLVESEAGAGTTVTWRVPLTDRTG
jgi:signal transduction histidine kinase